MPKPVGPLSLHWSRPPHMPQESTFCFEPTMRSHPTAFIFGEEKMKKKEAHFYRGHSRLFLLTDLDNSVGFPCRGRIPSQLENWNKSVPVGKNGCHFAIEQRIVIIFQLMILDTMQQSCLNGTGKYFLKRGCSQTTLTRFWLFWPPTSLRWHFWTTYLPRLVNVVTTQKGKFWQAITSKLRKCVLLLLFAS